MEKCVKERFSNGDITQIYTFTSKRRSATSRWERNNKKERKHYFSKISSIRCCKKINMEC